jgi:threonine/homoserine/homoserine lactone efflux protein
MNLMRTVDGALGRLFLRCCAVAAFLAAAAAIAFGAVVLFSGQIIGVLILAAAALFVWLGRLAWRDRATLGELLNRDFERATKRKPDTDGHDTL